MAVPGEPPEPPGAPDDRVWAGLAAAGFGPDRLVTLEVTGRRTGRTISFPVVVADYQGERYLVSMLGEDTTWVSAAPHSGSPPEPGQ